MKNENVENTSHIEIPAVTITPKITDTTLGAPVDYHSHNSAPSPVPTESKLKSVKSRPIFGRFYKTIAITSVILSSLSIIAIVTVFIIKTFRQTSPDNAPDDAFFVEQSSGSDRFAIFRRDGQRLTDFIYGNVSPFQGGHASACDAADYTKCGIVSSTGAETVKLGQYTSITSVGGLYVATQSSARRFLIDYRGKKLQQLPTDDADSTAKSFVFDDHAPFVAVKNQDSDYSLYNAYGDKLQDFQSTSLPYLIYDRRLPEHLFLFSDSQVFVLDSKNLKISLTASVGRIYHEISDLSSDHTLAIFSTGGEKPQYAVFDQRNFHSLASGTCETLSIYRDPTGRDNNQLNCRIKFIDYRLSDDLKPIDDYAIIHLDAHYYVKSQKSQLVFFKDNKELTAIENQHSYYPVVYGENLQTYAFFASNADNSVNRREMSLFSKEGKLLFKHQFKIDSYENRLIGPDASGNFLAVEIDPDQYHSAHATLLNANGETLYDRQDIRSALSSFNDEAGSIRSLGNVYLMPILKKSPNSWSFSTSYTLELVNYAGKVISSTTEAYDHFECLGNFIVASYGESYEDKKSITIYDLDGEALFTTKADAYDFQRNYFTIKTGTRTSFYNVTDAKLIYAQ